MNPRNATRWVSVLALFLSGVLWVSAAGAQCTTIKDWAFEASSGAQLTIGSDSFGYNYEHHMYKGRYCDSDRVVGGSDCDVELIMKWNEAWLSNKSCDGDTMLDRHIGYDVYGGSGAWLTNQQSGKVWVGGELENWTYFVKIVAAPAAAYKESGYWWSADGKSKIGPVIWGDFAIVREVWSDPSAGKHGRVYKSPVAPEAPGFLQW